MPKAISDPTPMPIPAGNRERGQRAQQPAAIERTLARREREHEGGDPDRQQRGDRELSGQEREAEADQGRGDDQEPGVDGLGQIEATEPVDVAGDSTPLGNGPGSIENWSRRRTMSAIPFVIWLPEPMATASLACLRAGTSLTPSPIMAVNLPESDRAPTSAFFCSGVILQKIVFSSAARASAAGIGGQVGTLDDSRIPRSTPRL